MCKKYVTCHYCGKEVNIRKPIIGGMHICLSSEHRNKIDAERAAIRNQLRDAGVLGSPFLGALGKWEDMPRQPQPPGNKDI